MAKEQQVRQDIDGFDIITTAIMSLVDEFPGLLEGEHWRFNSLEESHGKALFPTAGAIIESDFTDILGGHEQNCRYPFTLVYRAGGLTEDRRKKVKEFLDNVGRWLEKQPVIINGHTYKLDAYPVLTQGRRFTKIERTTPAVCGGNYENGAEDWIISITAHYQHNF